MGIVGKEYEKVLRHHGILGMKWGVRRTPEELGHLREPVSKNMKPRETTNVRSQFEGQSYKLYNNKKLMGKIKKAINGNEELKKAATDLEDSEKKLNDAFLEGNRRYIKEHGEEWSGDGTEMHSYLVENDSNYKRLSETHNRNMHSFVDKVNDVTTSDEIRRIPELADAKDFQGGIIFLGNGKTDAASFLIAKAAANAEFFPEDFFIPDDPKIKKERSYC